MRLCPCAPNEQKAARSEQRRRDIDTKCVGGLQVWSLHGAASYLNLGASFCTPPKSSAIEA
jgi:hypothetical protein